MADTGGFTPVAVRAYELANTRAELKNAVNLECFKDQKSKFALEYALRIYDIYLGYGANKAELLITPAEDIEPELVNQ